MLKFYGNEQPNPGRLHLIRPGGVCPACNIGTRFAMMTEPVSGAKREALRNIVIGYACDMCLEPVGIRWTIQSWSDEKTLTVHSPTLIERSTEPFDFEHVPAEVKKEIVEALDCLSVNALNGFAAVCRRSVQAICTNLGTEASTKIEKQINEMVDLIGAGDELKEIAVQVMLSGHDGSHPHLPEISVERADVLLSLLRDLTFQLYTRPGKVKESALLRKEAIAKKT